MSLSIVLISTGNNFSRSQNFVECYNCIKAQSYTDYELLIVEQADPKGEFYRGSFACDRHIKIKDPQNRPFNLSWCRNVGVVEAKNETVVIMDSDFVFADGYFEKISKVKTPFVGGATKYLWTTPEERAHYYQHRDLNYFVPRWRGWKSMHFSMGVGMGAIIIVQKSWVMNVCGPWTEAYFGYGHEDVEFYNRASHTLGVNENTVERVDHYCIHLDHDKADQSMTPKNISFGTRLKGLNQGALSKILISSGFGKMSGPVGLNLGGLT